MKKAFFLILIFTMAFHTTHLYADQKALSADAIKLTHEYEALKADPTNANLQGNYLNAFPKNKKAFKILFDQDDFSEFYESSDQYISLLGDISEKHEQEVGQVIISIVRDGASGCCDAWSSLHRVTTDFAVKYTSLFDSHLERLSPNQKENVIRFIADKENHHVFKNYQVIIDNLRKLRKNHLANQFEAARFRRMNAKDH
jgi:hypothetical protein